MNRVLLHPTYLPSISHMAALAQAKEVIWEVNDNYQKQTYRNRAHIAHANGRLVLSVPVAHSKDMSRQTTREVVPDNSFPWQDQHWKSLQSAYRSSPYFEYFEDDLRPLFTQPTQQLLTHLLELQRVLCDLVGLEHPELFTTEYEKKPDSSSDLRWLVESKKEPEFDFPPYVQVLADHGEFMSNLSVLDLLFNLGPNALDYLQSVPLSSYLKED